MTGYYNLRCFIVSKKEYGKKGFPWVYNKKLVIKSLSNNESLHDNNFLGFKVIQFDLNKKDILNISKAFQRFGPI